MPSLRELPLLITSSTGDQIRIFRVPLIFRYKSDMLMLESELMTILASLAKIGEISWAI